MPRGKRVRGVNRGRKANVLDGVEIVKSDLTDHVRVCQVCHGATVVYRCANAAYTDWYGLFPPITDGIINDLASTGAKLVFCDNLYMYGTVSGSIKEDLCYRATGGKGSTRAQMAATVIETHKSGKVRVTIGCASDYFGLHSLVS
jgi:hypothetical protein